MIFIKHFLGSKDVSSKKTYQNTSSHATGEIINLNFYFVYFPHKDTCMQAKLLRVTPNSL